MEKGMGLKVSGFLLFHKPDVVVAGENLLRGRGRATPLPRPESRRSRQRLGVCGRWWRGWAAFDIHFQITDSKAFTQPSFILQEQHDRRSLEEDCISGGGVVKASSTRL
jgi:hypothetical protein